MHSTKTNESVYYVIDRDEQTNMNETIEKLVMRELKKARANEETKHMFNNQQQHHTSGLKKLKVKFMQKLMDKKMREFMQQQMQQQQSQAAAGGKESER